MLHKQLSQANTQTYTHKQFTQANTTYANTHTQVKHAVALVKWLAPLPSAQTIRVRFPVGAQKKKIYFLAAFQCFGGHCKPSVQSAKSLSSSCFLKLIYRLKIKITFIYTHNLHRQPHNLHKHTQLTQAHTQLLYKRKHSLHKNTHNLHKHTQLTQAHT